MLIYRLFRSFSLRIELGSTIYLEATSLAYNNTPKKGKTYYSL